MSTWLWINVSLGALFVLAWVGVPLWLVITRPDTGPDGAGTAGWRRPHAPERAAAAPAAGPARRSPAARELAGARR